MSREYRPRRASKRWLEGAPPEVLDVFDAGDAYADRYTILLGGHYVYQRDPEQPPSPANTVIPYLASGPNPSSHRGVYLRDEFTAVRAAQYRRSAQRQRICWADLPEAVRTAVIQEINAP